MDISVKNFKIGLATIIACYLSLIFYILTLFLSIEVFGKDNMLYSFIIAGFLAAFVLAAGILFLVSLVFNIKQSKAAHKLSKGLVLTLISIPPIALCLFAFAVKALTEWRAFYRICRQVVYISRRHYIKSYLVCYSRYADRLLPII